MQLAKFMRKLEERKKAKLGKRGRSNEAHKVLKNSPIVEENDRMVEIPLGLATNYATAEFDAVFDHSGEDSSGLQWNMEDEMREPGLYSFTPHRGHRDMNNRTDIDRVARDRPRREQGCKHASIQKNDTRANDLECIDGGCNRVLYNLGNLEEVCEFDHPEFYENSRSKRRGKSQRNQTTEKRRVARARPLSAPSKGPPRRQRKNAHGHAHDNIRHAYI